MKKILIGILLAVFVIATMGTVNQGATTLIRDCWRADTASWPQWNFGNRSVAFDGDDFTVTNTYFPTGGLVEIDLVAGAGGSITTVTTEDPVTGDGTVSTPVTVADNAIDDTHIDWGLGAGQVNTDDMTEGSTNKYNVTHTGQVTGATSLTISTETVEDIIGADGRDTASIDFSYVDGSSEYMWDFTGTYTTVSANDVTTNITGTELETMTDGSNAAGLHTHTGLGTQNLWETIGTTAATTPTSTLLVADVSSETTVIFSGDGAIQTVTIGLVDDVITSTVTGENGMNAGDANTIGNSKIYDGSSNYVWLETQSMAADYGLAYPAVAPSINQLPYATGAQTASGAYILAWQNIPVDTDTDTNTYALTWDDLTPVTLNIAAYQGVTWPMPITATGTAIWTGVYISTWTPDFANIDTVTVTLYVDGVAKDSWTTAAGAAGSYGGVVSEALVQGHYCEIKAQITTRVVGTDLINIGSSACNVQVL